LEFAPTENFVPSSLTERAFAAAGVAAASCGAAFVAYFDPSQAGFFPVCPLYTLTGIACPGCGMTRGFHALFHGDILTSLDYNALIPLYSVVFGYFFVSMFLTAARGSGLPLKLFGGKFLWGIVAVSVVFAVVRNLPFYPFSVLYP
jgi:hypothetical protein